MPRLGTQHSIEQISAINQWKLTKINGTCFYSLSHNPVNFHLSIVDLCVVRSLLFCMTLRAQYIRLILTSWLHYKDHIYLVWTYDQKHKFKYSIDLIISVFVLLTAVVLPLWKVSIMTWRHRGTINKKNRNNKNQPFKNTYNFTYKIYILVF